MFGRGLLATVLTCALGAQDVVEFGPAPTRDMFPLALSTLVYQPVDPVPVGLGRWQVSLEHVRSNTFEFSDILKTQAPRDVEGRVVLSRDFVLAHAAEYASIPLIFYFDEEVVRSTLRVRYGIGEETDLWGELPFQSHGGGYLDGVIEGFHSLGFEQYGRDRVVKNQVVLVVMAAGQLLFYNDETIRGKTQDPSIGLTRRLASGGTWTLSGHVSLKVPLTTTYAAYRSGWEQSYGLSGRWQPVPRHLFHFGGAFIHRPRGNAAYTAMTQGGLRDGLGAHLGWEYRRAVRLHPFFQLHFQTGLMRPQPYQKLDRSSLQHDLGFHWHFRPEAALSLHYVNNITHNENTADMALGIGLDMRF